MDKNNLKDKDNQKDTEPEKLTDEQLDKVAGGAEQVHEQAHNEKMTEENGLAVIDAGSDFYGKTMPGLKDPNNLGDDGAPSLEAIKRGAKRY